jgi:hypothetical protein
MAKIAQPPERLRSAREALAGFRRVREYDEAAAKAYQRGMRHPGTYSGEREFATCDRFEVAANAWAIKVEAWFNIQIEEA